MGACLMSLTQSACFSSERTYVTFDGAWWTSMTVSEKLTAVQGMLVGYRGGYSDGAFSVVYKEAVAREQTDDPKMI